jgi:hypothetical protein
VLFSTPRVEQSKFTQFDGKGVLAQCSGPDFRFKFLYPAKLLISDSGSLLRIQFRLICTLGVGLPRKPVKLNQLLDDRKTVAALDASEAAVRRQISRTSTCLLGYAKMIRRPLRGLNELRSTVLN